MTQQDPETPIPMRAPGPEEDTDAVERQVSQRVDEGVDALDREGEAIDDSRYDRSRGDLDQASELDQNEDDTDDGDDVVDDLRAGMDDVSDRVRQAIGGSGR
jgi:hypothetical protein